MPRRRKTPKEPECSELPATTEGRPEPIRRGTGQDIGGSTGEGGGAGRGYVARVTGRGMDAQETGAIGGARGAQGQGPAGRSSTPLLVAQQGATAVHPQYTPPAGPVLVPDLPQAVAQQGTTAVHQRYAPAGPVPVPDLPQADASQSFAPLNYLPAGGPRGTTPSFVPNGTPASTAELGLSQNFKRQVSIRAPSSSNVQQGTGPATSSTAQQMSAPPVSSSNMRFPPRPDKGQTGVKCLVKANHFFAELPDKHLHQYDVTISPTVVSRGVNRAVMGQLVKLYRDNSLGRRLPVYDGKKSLYTAGPFPFQSKEFSVKLLDEDDGSGSARRERVFKVVIKLAARADLDHLRQFLSGRQADAPQEAIQVLDTVLRELPTHRFYPVGRSFYSPYFGECKQLGGGLESCRGFYQSIRPTEMGLSLVIDMSSTAFIQALPVVDFVSQLLNKDVCRCLSPEDRMKTKKALRGVKVEAMHRGNMRIKYCICGLTSEPTYELKFRLKDTGTLKSVVEYFKETYGYSIKYAALPCLEVGKKENPIYLPMEVCKIVAGQRYLNRLNPKQTTALLRASVQRPRDREKDIIKTVRQNSYADDPYAREFGIKISDEPVAVEARILPAPQLKYNDTGKVKAHRPEIGAWNMRDKRVVNGGVVEYWACINFSHEVQDSAAQSFCEKLALECEVAGMSFKRRTAIPILSAMPDKVEAVLKSVLREFKENAKGRDLELLVAILPDDNGTLYGDLKRICETDLGLLSQCCLTTPVIQMSDGYFRNLALKINVKVGGRNTVLVDALSRRIPRVSDIPTIIFGADVTHPHPGEDFSPSIAAVVASQDWPEATKYAGLFCAQKRRQELIQDLSKMTRELLISFRRATCRKPERIIFYRDGVSEGQFYQVLLHELDAIRKACASLESDYQPPVTFVVVQKRHHTRLFANNHNIRQSTDGSGNILPGTVVDSTISHPTNFDFYLCSHAGIQGTSRPAYYYVLWDENKFSADGLQLLTYNLCYTYARCTRSVSIVPPAYYAHHLAFRARFYMERESDSGSEEYPATSSSTSRSTSCSQTSVLPLPTAKMNAKCAMFYC